MNLGAFVLAVLGIVMFLVVDRGLTAKVTLGLGLALVSTAWVVQLVWGGASVTAH